MGGWLGKRDMIDFANSTVVHSVGSWAALAGALMVGPRLGKYIKDGISKSIPGYNIPLAALGVFILWFGWFGSNAGSTTSGTNLSIAIIAVTTNLSTSAGVIMAMFTAWFRFGKPDTSMALNGALAYYNIQAATWINISPDIQYILNPGGRGEDDSRDCLVIGLRVQMTF